jgi:hypothetical protein
MRSIALALLLACTASLAAQSPTPSTTPALATVLEQLNDQAAALQQRLPNFTCDESAISQVRRNGKLRRNATLTGTLRMVRDANGNLNETYDFIGHRRFLIGPVDLPFYVSGGFDAPLTYFLTSLQACYHYSLSPGRIDFEGLSDAGRPSFCKLPGLKGFALLNASGNVTHIERTVPLEVSAATKVVPYAAIDLISTELNGHTYQLSHHMVAERPIGDATYHFEATYSNYKLFAATVTIGPATVIPPDDPPAPKK